jgi:hypothetical protein
MSQIDIHQTSKPATRGARDSQTTVAEQRIDANAKPKKLLSNDEGLDEKRREGREPVDKVPKKRDADLGEAPPATEKPRMMKSAQRDAKPDEQPSLDIRASNSPRRNAPSGRPWAVIPTGAGTIYTHGTDALVDAQTHVTGATGSAHEVEKMFSLGKAKGWNPLAFNGGDAFKANVIREALKRGLEVKTFSERDAKLYADLEKEFLAARSQARDGRNESSMNDQRRQATPPKSDNKVGVPATSGIGNSVKDKSATNLLEEQKLNSGGGPRHAIARAALDRKTEQHRGTKVLSGH